MGYQFFSYSPTSPNLPRGAVMGGVVLAALSAWTDRYIIELFEDASIPQILMEIAAMELARKDLVETINDFFLYHINMYVCCSCFFFSDMASYMSIIIIIIYILQIKNCFGNIYMSKMYVYLFF